MTTVTASPGAPDEADTPRLVVRTPTTADRTYRRLALGGGVVTLLLLILIGTFLSLRALPALREGGFGFLSILEWNANSDPPVFGIAALLYWTVVIAVIALVIAVPIAVAASLFVTEYAPRRVRTALVTLIDLLAAVPSLIFGLWGVFFLQPRLVGLSGWSDRWLGWTAVLDSETTQYAGSAFIVGAVVALMILPIIASVVREVFSQTPPGEKEAALALGGSRWGMIRAVVLPFGTGGIIGGSMLGLGRALGETIAVAIIVNPIFLIHPRPVQTGANSIAAHIALRFGEANESELSALMAAGLILFIVTLGVNILATTVVSRSRSGAGVEL